jgi:hypothetical protein
MEAHALRAGIPKVDFTPCRQVRKGRFAYAPAICHGARQRPEMEFCLAKLRKLNVVEPSAPASGFKVRYAAAYPKQT